MMNPSDSPVAPNMAVSKSRELRQPRANCLPSGKTSNQFQSWCFFSDMCSCEGDDGNDRHIHLESCGVSCPEEQMADKTGKKMEVERFRLQRWKRASRRQQRGCRRLSPCLDGLCLLYVYCLGGGSRLSPTPKFQHAASDGSAHGDGAKGLGLLRPHGPPSTARRPVTLLAPDGARRRG